MPGSSPTCDHRRLADEVLAENPILVSKITAACGIEHDAVPAALTEVIRFLDLIVLSGDTLSPSISVDLAWHEFILCTRAYAAFCQQHFGRMMHHDPGGSDDKNRQQFQQTLALYRQHFGEPDPELWGPARPLTAGDCGDCGGCGGPGAL